MDSLRSKSPANLNDTQMTQLPNPTDTRIKYQTIPTPKTPVSPARLDRTFSQGQFGQTQSSPSPKRSARKAGGSPGPRSSILQRNADRDWCGRRTAVSCFNPHDKLKIAEVLGTWNNRRMKTEKVVVEKKTIRQVKSLPELMLLPSQAKPKGKDKQFDFGLSCLKHPHSRLGQRRPQSEMGGVNSHEGVVRDVHVLGIIHGVQGKALIVAFKGSGSLLVHLENVAGVIEGNRSDWEEIYQKYLPHSRCYRYLEFEVPTHLPCNLVVIGDTDPSDKPMHETRLRARLSSCGQVISSASHLASW